MVLLMTQECDDGGSLMEFSYTNSTHTDTLRTQIYSLKSCASRKRDDDERYRIRRVLWSVIEVGKVWKIVSGSINTFEIYSIVFFVINRITFGSGLFVSFLDFVRIQGNKDGGASMQ